MKTLRSSFVVVVAIWSTMNRLDVFSLVSVRGARGRRRRRISSLEASQGPSFQDQLKDQKEEQIPSRKNNGKEVTNRSENVRQLLGLPGAAAATRSTEKWKVLLQLTKPITWVPLAAGVVCGAAASGNYHWMWDDPPLLDQDSVLLGLEDAAKALLAMILAGPFMEGYSQSINDWYDKDIDAINEPYRPIPSGAVTEREVKTMIWCLLLGSISLAYGLDVWAGHDDFPTVLAIALFGSFVGYIYSAPPLKLKQNGWAGNFAIGFCYITLPWLCGHAAFGQLDRPVFWLLPTFYSIAGVGPAIANDFKSIEGDRAYGMNTIPVMFGARGASYICAVTQTLTQIGIASYLFSINEPTYATVLLGLIVPQIYFQATLLIPDPIENQVKFQASTQPLFSLGLLLTALCEGHHNWSAG